MTSVISRDAAVAAALNGCLVPPDGGSPTEAEVALCKRIAQALRAIPAADDWRPIDTAPKDGTLFLGCNLDHPSFGSWPMCRRVEHSITDDGRLVTRDLGAWLTLGGIEPDTHEGHTTRDPETAIAPDNCNTSVRYGWRPLPQPPQMKGENE